MSSIQHPQLFYLYSRSSVWLLLQNKTTNRQLSSIVLFVSSSPLFCIQANHTSPPPNYLIHGTGPQLSLHHLFLQHFEQIKPCYSVYLISLKQLSIHTLFIPLMYGLSELRRDLMLHALDYCFHCPTQATKIAN